MRQQHQMRLRASPASLLSAFLMMSQHIRPGLAEGLAGKTRAPRRSLFYLPNGPRECARRRRQLAKGQLVGIGAKA
jgi:hypothetical protein